MERTIKHPVTLSPKPLILLALAFFLSVGSLSAQTGKKNVIKIVPASLFVLTGNLQYERVLNERSSLNFGAYYGGFAFNIPLETTTERFTFKWAGLTPEYRFYLTGTAPNGLYAGPYLRFRRATIQYDQVESDPFGDPYVRHVKLRFLTAGGGGMIGYQAILGGWFSIDSYVGVGYNKSFLKVFDDTGNPDFEILEFINFQGVAIRPGVTLGVHF